MAVKRAIRGVSKRALERGTKRELEHTSDRAVARKIAIDHLAEDAGYYGNPDIGRVRVLKRPPVRLDGEELADLKGYLERVDLVDGRVFSWDAKEAIAYWHAESDSLVAFHGPRRPRARASRRTGRAADAFERWTGRSQGSAAELTFSGVERWVAIGRSVRLDYWSTKWPGKGPRYTHDTTTGPTLYRCGGPRGPWVWVVRGGGFTLTRDGLIG